MAIQNTTRLDLPYPDGDDPVTQGNDRIQGLAQAVDDVMATDDQGTVASRPAAGIVGAYYRATDQKVQYRDRGSGWDAIAFDPRRGLFSVYKTAGQTIGGGGNDFITFTGEEDDPNNCWDGSSVFTAPLAGHYEFGIHVVVLAVGANADLTAQIENIATGTSVPLREIADRRSDVAGEDVRLNGTTQIRLAAGAQIRLRLYNGDGSSRAVRGTGNVVDTSRFWGRLVAVNLDT